MVKKIVLFPGQGSLKKEVIKDKYVESDILRQTIDQVSEYSSCDLYARLVKDEVEDIFTKSYLIFAASLATFREFIMTQDTRNTILAGHSMGEITALACAEAITSKDAVELIRKRAEIAGEIINTSVYVVSNLNYQAVDNLCANLRLDYEKIWVSCDNSEQQVCIAGETRSLMKAKKLLEKLGAKVMLLKSNLPFHSKLLKEKSKQFETVLAGFHYKPLQYSVISNVTALPYEDETRIIWNLLHQFSETVRWRTIGKYLEMQSYEECYEMGYSDILTKMLSKTPHTWKTVKYI